MRTYTHTYIHARTRTIYTHIRLQCTTFFLISIFCLCFITCWTGIFRLTNISFAPAVRENNGTVARRTHARDSLAVNNRLRRIPSVYNNCFVITFFFLLLLFETHKNVTVFCAVIDDDVTDYAHFLFYLSKHRLALSAFPHLSGQRRSFKTFPPHRSSCRSICASEPP